MVDSLLPDTIVRSSRIFPTPDEPAPLLIPARMRNEPAGMKGRDVRVPWTFSIPGPTKRKRVLAVSLSTK
jgi:hypothetical protein